MCGETRVRVGFGPLLQGPKNPPSSSIYTALRASFKLWVLFRLKFAIAATSRTSFVFNNQTKTSQNPTWSIKLSSFIRNIQIAILVSCLFFVFSQETDPRGQVDHAPAWSITPRKLVYQLLRRDVSHVHSRIVKVDSDKNDSPISSKHRETFTSIKWYQISRLLGEILQFFVV